MIFDKLGRMVPQKLQPKETYHKCFLPPTGVSDLRAELSQQNRSRGVVKRKLPDPGLKH